MCLQYKPFENTVGKGEIARNEQFLLFSVFYLLGELPAIFIKFEIVVCKLFQFGSLTFVVWEMVNLYPTIQSSDNPREKALVSIVMTKRRKC